jgi:protein SCO1
MMSIPRQTRSCACTSAAGLLCLAAAASVCAARPADRTPPELEGVGITEHLDAQIPLDLEFVDENRKPVKLGDYFVGRRPVILTLNYYRCPMLCTLQLNGMVEALKELPWTPGDEFEIVTVSFDPAETPALAKVKKQNYMKEYARPSAARGWHFLTGSKKSIKTLTETVGFGYKWNQDRGEWMHVAALFICTPDGRISRYLYGVMFEPNAVRLSLVEASDGKVGSTLDRFILYCYHYDAEAGTYSLAAFNIMRLGGVLTVAVLGTALTTFWVREARRKKSAARESAA